MRTKHLIAELYKIGFARKEAFRLIRMYKDFRFKFSNSNILYSVKNTAVLRLGFIRSQKAIRKVAISASKATDAMKKLQGAVFMAPDKPQVATIGIPMPSMYFSPMLNNNHKDS